MREVAPTAQGGPKLLDAFYATPNPAAHRPLSPAPHGYWHVCYSHSGRQTWQQWFGITLVEDDEDQLYLKGGRSILVKVHPDICSCRTCWCMGHWC